MVMLALSIVASCGDEDVVGTDDVSPYKNEPQLRDHVLLNLQQAYADRNMDRYVQLLDENFVFFFSDDDVQKGAVQYDRWDRWAEIGATRNLFDSNFSKPGLEPASSITLQLDYAAGEDEWTEVTPPDPLAYPNEMWYEKIVKYSLTVRSGHCDYIGRDIRTVFTVRHASDSQGKKYWRIVLWRDDTGTFRGLLAHPRAPGVEDTTWGQLKALYFG
jgi:hypothetical protein